MTTNATVSATSSTLGPFDTDRPSNAHLTADGIAALAAVKIAQVDKHRRERANAIRGLLAWLSEFPGSD